VYFIFFYHQGDGTSDGDALILMLGVTLASVKHLKIVAKQYNAAVGSAVTSSAYVQSVVPPPHIGGCGLGNKLGIGFLHNN